ncbi:MAG: hypothetical protein FGF53_00820 [Candidatus Brockarchaeota archaeon]|nr:hypothetical protein [Candidatus Brockarchaeota archaeon]MBO3808463.1 hypothetical protein [Candidatus Brockarchaeota archaeon]
MSEETRKIRVPEKTMRKIRKHAKRLNMSPDEFATLAVSSLLEKVKSQG